MFRASRTETSTPVMMDNSPLCKTCSALDLNKCFREGVGQDNAIALGALTTILSQKASCGLCRMISLLISRSWCLDRLHPDEFDFTMVQVELVVLPCGWAECYDLDEPNTCAHSILITADRPSAITKMMKKEKKGLTMELQMMEDDAARFGRKCAFHGRRVGGEVSIERVKEWMQICEEEHGPDCASVLPKNATKQLPQGARMIDVVHMAIVEAPENCRYIALSYVWGKVSTEYVTLLENVAERHKRGNLKSLELPRTICDAIKLVQELKERYLWVDALCIIQDDPVNKDTQIAGMHMIYGMATLTIVAAGGNSAHAPLHGVEPGSRKVHQHIESIQSLRLEVPLRSLEEMLAGSVWDTRGWTYQEQILSRRKLFFTNEQVFFRCQRDLFAEDRIFESSEKTASYLTKFQGSIKLGTHNWHGKLYFHKNYARQFMQVVEEFTRRQLTNPADIYNAIFAIITVFSRDYEITPLDPKKAFLFGMPMSVLEDVMLWEPGLDAPAHVRRHENGLVTPSWAWSGWKGVVMYDANRYDHFEHFRHGLPQSWFEGSLVEEWIIGDPNGQARRFPTVRPLERPTYIDVPVKYLGLSSPQSARLVEEGESLVPGTLLFRTTAALLRVRKFERQVDDIPILEEVQVDYNKVFKILSDTSLPATMGKVVLPSDTDTAVPVQFVVLSRAEMWCAPDTFDQQVFGDRYYGCMLNVMAVKSVDILVDGIEVSERVGVGMIAEAAWIAAGFCERVVRLQ